MIRPFSSAVRDAGIASLDLAFTRDRIGRSLLTRREQRGQLVVQKALYPEGPDICHVVVVHPPAGIAGGDELRIDLGLDQGARALVTTPGATKWYRVREDGRPARQHVFAHLAADAVLEWLPQETIVFDRADGASELCVDLAPGACFIGWEVLCLGRTASGERFRAGSYRQRVTIRRDGKRLWNERGIVRGDAPLLASPAGFAGQPVSATLLAAGRDVPASLIEACRAAIADSSHTPRVALTRLPHVLVARYLGASSEEARAALLAVWRTLRPALTATAAIEPRLWRT